MVELPSPQPCRKNAGSVKAKFQGLMASRTFHCVPDEKKNVVFAQKHDSRFFRDFLIGVFGM